MHGGVSGGEALSPRLVLVGHDAFAAGAQQILLEIGRCLADETGMALEFVLLDGGRLEQDYRAVAPTHLAAGASEAGLAALARSFAERGFTAALVNTVAASRAVPLFEAAGIATVQLVHELPGIIRERHLGAAARAALTAARRVVFPAAPVRDAVLAEVGLPGDHRMLVRPQGLYRPIEPDPVGAARIRAALGLGPTARLVLGIGYADLRKGFDYFLHLGDLMGAQHPGEEVHLCWLGDMDPAIRTGLSDAIAAAEAAGRFHLPGRREDVGAFLNAADALLLTSREDSFPSVVLEGLAAGLPSIAFSASGGIPDLLRENGLGRVVPAGDVPAMAEALVEILGEETRESRDTRRRLVAARFDWRDYVRDLLELTLPQTASVSAAVPNFNYARYLPDRLASIFGQTYPVEQVVVLDDCSSDDSLAVIARVAVQTGRSLHVVRNDVNSGSVFAQWLKAAELAESEFVWIAEADDLAEPGFLATAVRLLQADPEMRLAFTDSRTVLADGTPQWESYTSYYATIEPGALTRTQIFAAEEFVGRFLAVTNVILNVSAVVWRRDALLESLRACERDLRGYRIAGDWHLYLDMLSRPGARIGYAARPLNVHRRHSESLTHTLDPNRHLAEITRCHRFAASAFPSLAESVAARQQAYRVQIASQLGAQLDEPALSETRDEV